MTSFGEYEDGWVTIIIYLAALYHVPASFCLPERSSVSQIRFYGYFHPLSTSHGPGLVPWLPVWLWKPNLSIWTDNKLLGFDNRHKSARIHCKTQANVTIEQRLLPALMTVCSVWKPRNKCSCFYAKTLIQYLSFKSSKEKRAEVQRVRRRFTYSDWVNK